jgi:NADPH-dependent 2,4-dienoyl-CoA reductase/sulfur reductase-like enzyme
VRHVIIGNGVAGINAANNIRSRDDAADITIVSKESDHFFSRTALMYVFSGQMSARDIEPYERDHYERMKFRRVKDDAVAIDSANKTVELKDGGSLSYDRLLIAAGSVARMVGWPGQDLDGVCNFVTWQDLQWMQEKARDAGRAVVVGGGLIGIECAEILLNAGKKVSFVIREDYYWPVALDQNESDVVVGHMRHRGCDVRLKTECKEVLGKDGKVVGILTGDDEVIDCDIVVFTIGVRPQTDWLSESGLEFDRAGGISVNEYLETGLPDVWGAGDCTSVEWFNGVRRPEQLWYTSRDQGRIAGYNMVGDKRIYKRATFYNSAKLFDLEYTTAGNVNFKFDGEQNWFQKEADGNRTERITYLPNQTVVGFNMIGRRWDHRILVRWVDEERTLEWVLNHLQDAIFDEEFAPRFRVLKGV